MAYTPPANNAIDFALSAYTAPANNAISFELASTTGITGTVAEAQAKSTEAISGSQAYSGSVVEAQGANTEAVTGSQSFTALVEEDQPRQSESITGTIPATPVTGTVDEAQPKQEESARCVVADTAREVDFNGGGGWVPFDPYGDIHEKNHPSIGGTVSESTRKPTEEIQAAITIQARVVESVKIESTVSARIGRGRAERDKDIEAILLAVA